MIALFQAERYSPDKRQRLKRYVSGTAGTDTSSHNIVFGNPSISSAFPGPKCLIRPFLGHVLLGHLGLDIRPKCLISAFPK